MKRLFSMGSCVTLILALPLGVQAQTPDFSRCTTANVFAGGANAPSTRQPLFGGAIGWELTPHLSVEASTKWLIPDRGAEAFSAVFTAQVPITGRRTFVPFMTAGMGVHRASFDLFESDIPDFYARRISALGPLAGTRRVFMDPAFVAGGGVSIFASRHFSVRPEVEMLLVRQASRNYVMTSMTVRVAYHFETHRITP